LACSIDNPDDCVACGSWYLAPPEYHTARIKNPLEHLEGIFTFL
jgi:uncharacterized metal-binding protein YceD (DUF177 family)